jgi:hypothetical protein
MATQTDETKSTWLNWLAITTIIMSASATLGSAKSGGFGSSAMMAQNRASDQWAFYQAKSIKGHTYELQKDGLLILTAQAKGESQQAAQAKVAEYENKIATYKKEREDIQAEAKKFEDLRDHSLTNSAIFGRAVIYLQIGITLSALAALLKKKPVWALSVVVGLFGMLYFFNGFLYTSHGTTWLIGKF